MYKKLYLNQRVMSTVWFMHNAVFPQNHKLVGEAQQKDSRGICKGKTFSHAFHSILTSKNKNIILHIVGKRVEPKLFCLT